MTTFSGGMGQGKCRGDGTKPCGNNVIDGLEHCLHHVPDEDLEEAEEATGTRRCRHRFGEADACHQYAASGTEPPACANHGANAGSMTRVEGARREVEGRMTSILADIMRDGGEKLLDPPPIGDPLTEMLELAAEVKQLKELLRVVVAHLVSQDRIRYAHSKVGEQLRMELLLYERAVERTAKVMIDLSKMKIDERLAGVQEKTADMLEMAVTAALQESGVGLEGQASARKAFRRHLKVVQGTLAS